MTAEEFMRRLRQELSALPFEEREAALRYYTEYLIEAGSEHEQEALRALGTPEQVAAQIIQDRQAPATWPAHKPPQAKREKFTSTLIGKCCISLVFIFLLLGICVLLRDLLLPPKISAEEIAPSQITSAAGKLTAIDLPWSENTITNWTVDLNVGYLHIIPGEAYQLQLGSTLLEHTVCTLEDGTLRITDSSHNKWWTKLKNTPEEDLTITLTYPQTTEPLNRVDLHLGIGPSDILGLHCDSLTIETGVGEVLLENITAANFTLDGGVGEVTGHHLAVSHQLSVDSGVGEINLSGDFVGILRLDNGVGEAELTLARPQSAYSITTDTGLGDLTIDSHSQLKPSPALPADASDNTLDIDYGIGDVTLHFTPEP